MDRPVRYKAQVAHRRIPLQEASSRANTGQATQMAKPTYPAFDKVVDNDENSNPNENVLRQAGIVHETRQQIFDKRVATSHVHNVINNLRPRKTHIGPWQLGCTIGQGGSCTVRLVRHVKTGENAVAKIIHKKTAEKVRARSLVDLMARVERGDHQLGGKFPLPIALEREIVIMRLLDHPNIVRIYDVWENSNEIYLIMENVDGGELFQYLSSRGALREDEAVFLFRQLVEALAYCHRLSIFHRDLKPENILLDKNSCIVKLIDFGMAAYQPSGDKLKTPCGSPHYAAPELLQGQPYDGSKADVWSLGVIMYLMLVGDLPFNFRPDDPEHMKLRNLYNHILTAEVKIPRSLSLEAQSTLRRIFVADPKKRLDMFELWNQPLLHKYDRKYGWEDRTLDTWPGDPPAIENWKALRSDTIDPHIFRNLQTLWHDVKEEALIKKLCNNEMNEEKYFYYALRRYQEEQLDSMDYSPARTGLVVSASDYHHSRVIRPEYRLETHKRSNSQFSVFHQEHMASKHSFFEPLSDKDHFDPFGISSLDPQPSSSGSPSMPTPVIRIVKPVPTKPGAQRNSLRVETLKRRGSLRNSAGGRGSTSSARLSSGSKRSQSTSVGSIRQQLSPTPILVRPGDKHKRVSFDHRRRPISASASSGVLPLPQSPEKTSSGLPLPAVLPSSPPAEFSTVSKHQQSAQVAPTPRTRRLREFDIEARKVSNELGKVCEEAFFRSSVSEKSFISSLSDPAINNPADTPPSSLSNQSSNKTQRAGPLEKSMLDRPLPPPPGDETPGSYTARELQQIRNRLALRYAQDGASNQKYFNDILMQLDRLVPSTYMQDSQLQKRHGSVHRLSDLNLLQSIPEEERRLDQDDSPTVGNSLLLQGKPSNQPLNLTSPTPARKNTIRVVEPSSPARPALWAPLSIRKASAMSSESEATAIRRPGANSNNVSPSCNVVLKPPKHPWFRRSSGSWENTSRAGAFSPNQEWEDLDDRFTSRRDRQRKLKAGKRANPATNGGTCLDVFDEIMNHQQHKALFEYDQDTSLIQATDEWGQAVTEAVTSPFETRRGFFRGLFQRRRLPKTVYNVDTNSSMNTLDKLSEEYESGITTAKTTTSQKQGSQPGEWNLIHRLLRIKPESRVLVMCHSRRVARNILSQLILAEEKHGIKDLTREAENRNSFTVRLDKENIWRMKPVWFAMELFSILRDGRTSKLTAVRFTQTGGSAQSLRKLVELLGGYLKADHLHDKVQETKEIVSLIKTGRPDIKEC